MNKNVLIFVAIFIALIGGSLAFLAAKPDSKNSSDLVEQMLQQNQSDTTKQTDAQQTAPANTNPGKYIDYSEANLANASGQRVLFFHASWCGQCRQLDEDIKKDPIPDGLTILKVDYDTNQDLRQKYGVTFQTTFVKIDAQGNRIGKPYIAYDEPTFDAVKRDFL